MREIYKRMYVVAEERDGRDPYADNLRFAMILLVVIGHFITNSGLEKYRYLYYFIYLFHMPCFVFLSGYFSKRMNQNGRFRAEKVIGIFWLFLLMKTVDFLIARGFGRDVGLDLFYNSGAPWYLLSLTVWYLMIPALMQIKPYIMLILSVFFALLAGYDERINQVFSISRTLVFFPFFLLGFYCSNERLKRFLKLKLKLPAFLFLTAAFLFMIFYGYEIVPYQSALYGAVPYQRGFSGLWMYGIIIRGIWYVIAFLSSASVMLLIPRGRFVFTVLGQRTLPIYVLHIWVRSVLTYMGFFTFMKGSRLTALLLLPAAVLLTLFLAIKPFQKLFEILSGNALLRYLLK